MASSFETLRGMAGKFVLSLMVALLLTGFFACGEEENDDDATGPTSTPPPLDLAGSVLPDGQERLAYSAQLEATGGVPPYRFEVLSGELPYGLQLDMATGALDGTPSLAGSYTFEIRLADDAGQTDKETFLVSVSTWNTPIPIACGESSTVVLTESAYNAEGGYQFESEDAVVFYELILPPPETTLVTLNATSPDGDPALFVGRRYEPIGSEQESYYYMTSIHPGDEELRIDEASTRTISYYLAAGQNISVVLAATTPGEMTLEVTCAEGAVLTTPFLPNAILGEPYQTALEAMSGTPPYRFLPVTELPPGIELSEDGIISGVIEQPDDYALSIQLIDANGTGESRTLQLWAPDPVPLTCDEADIDLYFDTWAFEGQDGLATVGGALFFDLEPSPGTSSVRLEISQQDEAYTLGLLLGVPGQSAGSSELDDYVHWVFDSPGDDPDPVFLMLDSIDLPPLAEYGEHVPFALAAQDGAGPATLRVVCSQALDIRTQFLPNGSVDLPYEATLEASGGRAPYQWSADGALPSGLQVSEEGSLYGTPTETGRFSPTLTVIDADGTVASRTTGFDIGPVESAPGCGNAPPLTCDDFASGKLEASAWVDRVEVDFAIPGSTAFYCLLLPETVAEVTILANSSSGDADLFVGYPGMAPGDTDDGHYWYFSTFEGDDQVVVDELSFPELFTYQGLMGIAVPAYDPGQYLLSIECSQ